MLRIRSCSSLQSKVYQKIEAQGNAKEARDITPV